MITENKIKKSVRNDLWIKYWGYEYFGYCWVCATKIDTHNFEAGHIISKHNNGKDNIENLAPVCHKCNSPSGMYTMNMIEYKNLHYPDEKYKVNSLIQPEQYIEKINKEKDEKKKEMEKFVKEITDDISKRFIEKYYPEELFPNKTKEVIDNLEKITRQISSIELPRRIKEYEIIIDSSRCAESKALTKGEAKTYWNSLIGEIKIKEMFNALKLPNSINLKFKKYKNGTILFSNVLLKMIYCGIEVPEEEMKTLGKYLIDNKEAIKNEFNVELWFTQTECHGGIFKVYLENTNIKDTSKFQEYHEWHVKTLNTLNIIIEKYLNK